VRSCHTGPPKQPKMCSLCGKSFKNIAFHKYKVHSGIVNECHLCDFKTSLKCSLRKHIAQVHEGQTQTCDMCGKVVKELKQHKVRGCPYGKKRPHYQCDHCEKSFTLKNGLNRHLRAVHFKIKDHSCAKCNYTTAESFNLRMHIARVHEGKKVVLSCPLCNKNVVNLEWHLEQYHKDCLVFLDDDTRQSAAKELNLESLEPTTKSPTVVVGDGQLDLTHSSVHLLPEVDHADGLPPETQHFIFPLTGSI